MEKRSQSSVNPWTAPQLDATSVADVGRFIHPGLLQREESLLQTPQLFNRERKQMGVQVSGARERILP